MGNLDRYTIFLDQDMSLLTSLNDESSDIQAWGAASLIEIVSGPNDVNTHPCVDQFLGTLIDEHESILGAILLSQIYDTDHPWISTYLSERVGRASNEDEVSKIVQLFDLFSKLRMVDPYEAIPRLIESLDEETSVARQKIFEMIAKLETSKAESKSEFVRSSYEWNIRSVYLKRERWMSLMGIMGTLLYAIALSLITSLSLPYGNSQGLVLVGIANLCALIAIVSLFILCVYRISETEKSLQPRLEIDREFLTKRKEMRVQIIDYYVSFLEKTHEKWRNILTTLIRFYMTVMISSVIAILLGRLPVEIMRYLLTGLTFLFLTLCVLTYKKMQNIETELTQKQRMLRMYYGK